MRKAVACCWPWVVCGLLVAHPSLAQQTLPEIGVEAPRRTPEGAGVPSGGPGVFGEPFGVAPQPTLGGLPQPAPEGPQQPTPERAQQPTPEGTQQAGQPPSSFSDRVGPYNQPAWTTFRPFPTTRSYVIPEGQVEFEQWFRPKHPRHGKTETQYLEELAIGLPYRLQVDVYERWDVDPSEEGHERAVQEGISVEGRWALANWGVIPLNPTLYAEWLQGSRAEPDKFDRYEFKLLLADELASRLYYAANVTFEQETGGEREQEIAFSQAFSTPLIDGKLLFGVEMVLESTTVRGERGRPEVEFDIGPSVQWRPTARTFVDVVPLFGTTKDSPAVELFVIAGINFGRVAGTRGGIAAPVSTAGR